MTRGREKGGKCGKKKMGEDTGSRGKGRENSDTKGKINAK
jgi:hypothetical protein